MSTSTSQSANAASASPTPDLSYRASLKTPAVEEPIDLLVHRPLGYAVARLAHPTPLTPDLITLASMVTGVAAGVVFLGPVFGWWRLHNELGAALMVLSAVLDCADGQLARMRKRSSRFGRALDGAVDAVVQVSTVPALIIQMAWRRGAMEPATIAWVIAAVVAVLTGLRHTTLYDQLKNVYVRNTEPVARDCDDLDVVQKDWDERKAKGDVTLVQRFAIRMLLVHLTLSAKTIAFIDGNIPARFADMPKYSPARAARFKALHYGLMRVWANFGIGTHIFTLALCAAIDRVELYILLRLVGFNGLLLLLLPLQRRASKEFFEDPDGDSEPDDDAEAATA